MREYLVAWFFIFMLAGCASLPFTPTGGEFTDNDGTLYKCVPNKMQVNLLDCTWKTTDGQMLSGTFDLNFFLKSSEGK